MWRCAPRFFITAGPEGCRVQFGEASGGSWKRQETRISISLILKKSFDNFKDAFGKNYRSYKRNYDEAIKQIDTLSNAWCCQSAS